MNKKIRRTIAVQNQEIIKKQQNKFNIHEPIIFEATTKNTVPQGSKNTKITVYDGSTNQAIQYIFSMNPSYRIAILNFASANNAGGGYFNGAGTQEEELCRTIPDLYPSLSFHGSKLNLFHSIKQVKYNSDLTLYRQDCFQSYDTYPVLSEFKNVSVISAAAPNCNLERNINLLRTNKDLLFEEIIKKIETIYLSPILANDNINAIVLGAFGCGAFAPSITLQEECHLDYPKEIARVFNNTIYKYPNLYDHVFFAIPTKFDDYNYHAFSQTISKKY
jgi:uncharacterized protein (TIGR02452 family)